MKRLIALFSVAVTFGASLASASDNIAYCDDNVRFTVITDASIRMEYAPDGNFVDDKSQVAVVRDYPEVPFKVKNGNWIEITTPKVKLRYKKGSGKFTADNMSVSGVKGAFQFNWKPGTEQKSNLKGTYRTLDGCIGEYHGPLSANKKIEMEDGLLARDGWTLIDDSKSYLFDGASDWDWVKERNSAPDAQDWYFMAYGNDSARLSPISLYSPARCLCLPAILSDIGGAATGHTATRNSATLLTKWSHTIFPLTFLWWIWTGTISTENAADGPVSAGTRLSSPSPTNS